MKQEGEKTEQGVVKIRIDGIAACYHKNGDWSVVFICDETHELNFYDQRQLNRISLKGAEFIRITAENTTKPTEPAKGEEHDGLNFCKTFNLTADYAHDRGVKPTHRERDRNCNCTLMTIKDAVFYMAEQTDKKYDSVLDVVSPAGDKDENNKPADFVANAVGAEITMPAGSWLRIETNEGLVKRYQISGYEELRLFFDNNCHSGKCDSESDFKMYYKHFKDAVEPDRKFKVKQSGVTLKTPGRTNCYPVFVSKLIDAVEVSE